MSLTANRPRQAVENAAKTPTIEVNTVAKKEKLPVFSARNSAVAIDDSISKSRVVADSVFLKHINKTVIEGALGNQLQPEILAQLLNGISEQCLVLAEQGYRVRIPNLVVMEKAERKSKTARNMQTGEKITVPARTVLVCKPTKQAKERIAK